MNKRLASLLSLTGVLVAGSAAAVVNTRILADDGGPATGPAAAATTSLAADATVSTSVVETVSPVPTSSTDPVSTTVDGSSTSAPVSTSSVSTPVSSSVPSTVPGAATTQAAYSIGAAGTVILDTAGDVLTIVSATPNPGWVVEEAESKGPLAIEVEFDSGATVVEFEANLLFGVVSTSVEVKSDDSGPSTSASGPGTTENDDGPSTSVDDHGGRGSGSDSDNSGSGSSGSGSGNSGSDSSGSGSGGSDDD